MSNDEDRQFVPVKTNSDPFFFFIAMTQTLFGDVRLLGRHLYVPSKFASSSGDLLSLIGSCRPAIAPDGVLSVWRITLSSRTTSCRAQEMWNDNSVLDPVRVAVRSLACSLRTELLFAMTCASFKIYFQFFFLTSCERRATYESWSYDRKWKHSRRPNMLRTGSHQRTEK